MALTNVGIRFQVYNEGAANVRGILSDVRRIRSQFRLLTGIGIGYFSLRGLVSGFKEAAMMSDEAKAANAQYQASIDHLKAAIGQELAPTMATFFQSLSSWLRTNEGDIVGWANATVKTLAAVVTEYQRAQKAVSDFAASQLTEIAAKSAAQGAYEKLYPGERFAFKGEVVKPFAGFGGGVQIPEGPAHPDVYNRLLQEYRQNIQGMVPTYGARSFSAMMGVAPAYDFKAAAAAESEAKKVQATEDKMVKARIDATARLYRDLKGMRQANYKAELNVLMLQAADYMKLGVEELAVRTWYYDQIEQLQIRDLQSSDEMADGFHAAMLQMERDTQTWGQIGYDTAVQFRDEMRTTFSEIMRGSKDVGQALTEMFQNAAYGYMERAYINPATTSIVEGIGSLFSPPTAGRQIVEDWYSPDSAKGFGRAKAPAAVSIQVLNQSGVPIEAETTSVTVSGGKVVAAMMIRGARSRDAYSRYLRRRTGP